MRVRKDAVSKFVDASGNRGLLFKDFAGEGSPEWIKPLPAGEDGPAHLTRCRQMAIDAGIPGLAFSASGSLGIRRPVGSVRSSFSIRGLPRDSPDAAVKEFLEEARWTDVHVVDTNWRTRSISTSAAMLK